MRHNCPVWSIEVAIKNTIFKIILPENFINKYVPVDLISLNCPFFAVPTSAWWKIGNMAVFVLGL